jgi:hypothetical protein
MVVGGAWLCLCMEPALSHSITCNPALIGVSEAETTVSNLGIPVDDSFCFCCNGYSPPPLECDVIPAALGSTNLHAPSSVGCSIPFLGIGCRNAAALLSLRPTVSLSVMPSAAIFTSSDWSSAWRGSSLVGLSGAGSEPRFNSSPSFGKVYCLREVILWM